MAEGGDSVDSGRNNLCNICGEGDLSVPADYFCVSCEQYLCEDCKQYHSRVKATKSHHVTGINEIPSLTSLTLGSEAMETPICGEHQRQFEYFCVDHMTVLCQTCKLIEHNACRNVTGLKEAACDVFSEGHNRNIHMSVKELLNYFSKCKDKIQSNRDELHKSKQTELDKVRQTIAKIKIYLDKLETVAYEEIITAFEKELKQIDGKLHVADVSIIQMKKRINKIERAMELGDKEAEFVILNSVTKEIQHQCNLLQNSVADTCDIDFTFRNSDSIDKLSKLLPSLGTVFVTKSPAFQSDAGTVAIYTGELKTRTVTDTKDPVISSYEMLSDGRHIIADQENNKLKLYDSNNQFLSELVLPDWPKAVVLLHDTETVVSLPNINSLQYVTVGTDLALSKTRKMNYRPLAMVKYGGDILATVRDGVCKVVVIDSHGKVKRTIYKDNGSLLSMPFYIDLSVDNKTVYVVDEDKGCIGLSMDGNVVFNYQDQKVQLYSGLAVGRDSVFIGVRQDKVWKVRRLSCSGDHVEDLDLGRSTPRKMIENNLVIRNGDTGEILIQFFYLL